jgi:hypothetical protein
VPIHASRGEAEGFIHAQVNKGAGGFRRQAASARQHQVRLARTMVVSASRKLDSKRTYLAIAALRDVFAHASRSIFSIS